MKRRILTSFLLYACLSCFNYSSAQQTKSEQLSQIAVPEEAEGWLKFRTELNLQPEQIFNANARAFGLDASHSMVQMQAKKDKLGYTHHRFQQYYRGVPVEGAEFTIHSRNGIAEKGNGRLESDMEIDPVPTISREQAIQLALQCVSAAKYNWESEASEAALKNATGDPDASFYPHPELLIADENFNPDDQDNYALTWKVEIHSLSPQGRNWVYIDAHSGQVFKELDMMMHGNWEGTAETRYHGTRMIVSDSTDQGFRLRENGRGACEGIETYNMNDSTDYDYATDFWDDDNHWNNVNEHFDEAAGDTHWGAEMTYDYYWQKHGRNSYDDEGSKMISYIHYDNNWRNARWTGRWALFGDGTSNPWVSIDVVSHEFTHGVTRNSSNLIYSGESGALNESFSDIFGKAVEVFAVPETFSWRLNDLIGEPIRNMADPNEFDDPDTYKGNLWHMASSDNGGVHTNSGVQNYWFHLLVEGGTGINDHGEPFEVQGMGWDTAAAIAYRNLTVYLQRFSQYIDARLGTLEAAADLYGRCSDVYMQVANAWQAVGVGGPISSSDFGVVSIQPLPHCGLGSEEEIAVQIRYFGCDTIDSATIPVKLVKTNPIKTQNEVINYEEQIVPDQVIEFVFPNKLDFTKGGEHLVRAETTIGDDPTAGNNASEFTTYNLKDMSLAKFDFEDYPGPSRLGDSIIFFEGDFNLLQVKPFIGKDSSYAIMIEGGGDFEQAREPDEDDDVFDINSEFGSRICFCMNTEDLLTLYLSFDLRQTFSMLYDSLFEMPVPEASALRVLANGDELARYYPATYIDDPFVNHMVDLSDYTGTNFDLCFESRTIMASWADPDTLGLSFGDRIFIDNLFLTGDTVETAVHDIPGLREMKVFPNPAVDMALVMLDTDEGLNIRLSLHTLNGQIVRSENYMLSTGRNNLPIALNNLAPGMYFIRVTSGKGSAVKKLLIQ